MSFQSFAICCVEYGLFSVVSQRAFLKATNNQECIIELQRSSPQQRIKIVEERFRAVGLYELYHTNWIAPIEQALKVDYMKKANVILIKLKLIEAESIRTFIEYAIDFTMVE